MAEPLRSQPGKISPTASRPLADRRGTPGLLARFESMSKAREAMVGLQNAGIDAADVKLVGKRASRASRRSRRAAETGRVDQAIARRIVSSSISDSVRVALLGAGAGVVVGVVLALITGSWFLVPVAVVVLAVLSGVVGAMVGMERSTGLADTWELTFQEGEPGAVWVAVYAGDVTRAHEVLDAQGASAFRRPADLDALGRLYGGIDTGRRPA